MSFLLIHLFSKTYSLCGMSSAWARTPGIGVTAATSKMRTWTKATTAAGQQQHTLPAKNMMIYQ